MSRSLSLTVPALVAMSCSVRVAYGRSSYFLAEGRRDGVDGACQGAAVDGGVSCSSLYVGVPGQGLRRLEVPRHLIRLRQVAMTKRMERVGDPHRLQELVSDLSDRPRGQGAAVGA